MPAAVNGRVFVFIEDAASSSLRSRSDRFVAPFAVSAYTFSVAEKEATRGESRKVPGRTTAAKRFFYVCIPLRAFSYGRALVGVRLRTPVPLDAGLSTLPSARPPHLRVGTRVAQPVQGSRTMRNFSARFELVTFPVVPYWSALIEVRHA